MPSELDSPPTAETPGATGSPPPTVTAPTPSRTSSNATSPPPDPPRRTPSISDPNLRVCFICLLNSAETPEATWVNPCPCTLEAHEECMLKWVAQMEASGNSGGGGGGGGGGRRGSRNKSGLRCPACKGVIQVFEPFDLVIWARDRAYRAFSRASPVVLLGMMGSFAVAGSAHYGVMAMCTFAGGNTTMQWLGVSNLLRRPDRVPWWMHGPSYSFVGKVWLLHLIAPGLLLNKAIPGIDTYILLPVSLVYGFSMVARDNMPQWPPSPAWAMTLLPCVSLSYSHIYYEFFGRFEKRLNNVLRGREVEEDGADQAQRQPREQGQQQQRRGGDARGNNIGIGTALFRLAGAFVNLFLGDDAAVEIVDDDEADRVEIEEHIEIDVNLDEDGELQIELHGNEEGAEGEDEQLRAVLMDAIEAAEPPNIEGPAAGRQEEQEVQDAEQARPEGPNPVDAVPDANQHQNEVNQENQNRPQRQRQVDGGNGGGPFSGIINGTVSALILPEISYVMGEILRVTLPSRWVQRARWGKPRGLLQERWGRSLVGGCLFVVLRDALLLYIKYRRVQLRKNRRVKNVERRGERRVGASAAAS